MRHSRIIRLALLAAFAAPLAACGPGDRAEEPAAADQASETTATGPEPAAEHEAEAVDTLSTVPVVEIIAREYAFQAPDSIPSGWTTFRLRNEGSQHHFLMIYRLPDGKTQADVQNHVVPVYDRVMKALQDGGMDKAAAMETLGNELPPWFFTVAFRGGPGLIAPGMVSQTTVELAEPGLYLMECYVKGPDGRFHSSMGMQRQFTVTEGRIRSEPPTADVTLALSNDGIDAPASLDPGAHTVRVDFKADPPGGLPYDVHVARLADDTDIDALRRWMDWMNVGGLRAPAPVEFLGGAENMSAGNTAYFTVDLEPGRYAWLSEVGASDKMYREFTVE